MQTLNLEMREQLVHLYVNQKLSTYEIARKLVKTERTICRWMNAYGIPRRKKSKLDIPILDNKHWLIEMYVNQKKSAREIGRIINASDEKVRKALVSHNIPRRKQKKNNPIKKQNAEKIQNIKVTNHQHGTWSLMM